MYDAAIVGGGCIGLSIAKHLVEAGDLDVCVLEKEYHLAQHQSGRNSGVLHPGFNYPPGSLKARFSTAGTRRMKEFCRNHDVPLEEFGVVVVATTDEEEKQLTMLRDQAEANGLETTILNSQAEINEFEPHAVGQAALHCPEAASVDSQQYVYTLKRQVEQVADVLLGHAVTGITDRGDRFRIESTGGGVEAEHVINAAGLQADRIAHEMGMGSEYRIIPFRGTYYELVPDRRHLVESMIYPTPHPEYPFLGIHYTRRSDDKVIVGPNAALAFGRESYLHGINLRDIASMLSFSGFWRMFTSPIMVRAGLAELNKTYRKKAFLNASQKLLPEVRNEDLQRSYTGIRAQVVRRDGTLLSDPLVVSDDRSTHVLNAVSPGFTSSLPFGEHVAEQVLESKA